MNTKRICTLLCLLAFAIPALAEEGDDLDAYKIRISALWWGFEPIGTIGTSRIGNWDLKQDFGFQQTSTFTGNFDWRFAHKHHFLFDVTPMQIERNTVLNRTISFDGQTFPAGIETRARGEWNSFAPGYQYDFLRRDRGYIALAAHVNILDPSGSLTANITVGSRTETRTATAHHIVGLPIAGAHTRYYLIRGSSRLAVDAYAEGMYFGKYGDYWSGRGSVIFEVIHPLRIVGGYQFGTRLNFKGPSNDLAVRLFNQGPVAGIELSF